MRGQYGSLYFQWGSWLDLQYIREYFSCNWILLISMINYINHGGLQWRLWWHTKMKWNSWQCHYRYHQVQLVWSGLLAVRGVALSAQCWQQGKRNCRVKWKHGEGDPLREHCVFNIRRGENFLIRPLGNNGRHFLSTFISYNCFFVFFFDPIVVKV